MQSLDADIYMILVQLQVLNKYFLIFSTWKPITISKCWRPHRNNPHASLSSAGTMVSSGLRQKCQKSSFTQIEHFNKHIQDSCAAKFELLITERDLVIKQGSPRENWGGQESDLSTTTIMWMQPTKMVIHSLVNTYHISQSKIAAFGVWWGSHIYIGKQTKRQIDS